MNVLVTGGAGFVGYNLIKQLCKNDSTFSKIISLDNYSSGNSKNHIDNNKVFYINDSTDNILSIEKLSDFKPDIVFHFGEFSRISLSFEKINDTFKSNSLGTQQVLEYCIKHDSKLIYSGSSAIFGDDNSNLSPYSWLKAKNIELIKNYEKWFGLRYNICYFYNAYGPKQIKKGDYATVVGIFEEQFSNNLPITVVGDGLQTRIFTHIDDIVNGLIKVALYGNGDGYHLGRHDSISILELAKLFSDNIIHVPERKGERKHSIMQLSRAETELGWKAEKSIRDYIKIIKEK